MKSLKAILFFLVLVTLSTVEGLQAQPFTLDDKIKPVELALIEETRKGHEGEKSIVTLSTVDSTRYYFVSGHEMWQFLDILVTPLDDVASPIEVSLAQDNWESPNMVKTSRDAEDGIISFKTRTWSKFGIKIKSLENKTVNFSIIVLASPRQKSYLENPFTKIKKSEMKAGSDGNTSNNGNGDSGGGKTILYILLGVAILVIGLLGGKLLGKKSAAVIVLLITSSLPVNAQYAPAGGEGFWYDDKFFTQADLEGGKLTEHLDDKYKEFGKKTQAIAKKMRGIKATLLSAVNLYKNYKGLTDCINATPPAAPPRLPSFCTVIIEETIGQHTFQEKYEIEGCADCFLDARKDFNNVRYLFEQLVTIYKCTKNFSNAAIAFGDNVSGYHGVSGMAWQTQKIAIEKSVRELENAYDNKYAELLQSLSDAMYKLSECEAHYGVEDWFDRFGYMYFEFMQEKYKRKD